MNEYKKPLILFVDDISEPVYMSSGGNGVVKCDSKYMNGIYKPQNYNTNKYDNYTVLGCTGCPAFRANGCGLQLDYVNTNYATSYDVDNGNRMPMWEKLGKSKDANYWE